MDQAYLISLVEGFYPFGKRSKTDTKKQSSLSHAGDIYDRSAGALAVPAVAALSAAADTGVARYLKARPVESGVAKYLKKNGAGSVTGVGKYLVAQSILSRETVRVTGVNKYLARFDSNVPASGVAKYVAQRIIQTKYLPKRTSVGKYITRQEIAEAKLAALTGVAKYQAEQDLLQRKIDAQKLIERYRAEEARLAAEKAAAPKQDLAVENTEIAVEDVAAETSVGRYFQQKAKLDSEKPSVSKVAKYIAQQVVRDSLKPRQSGVARYLVKSRVYAPKPVVSSVAKYLETQALSAKTKPAYSGVAKYLIKRRLVVPTKPVQVSGVEKYLAQQVKAVDVAVKRGDVLTGVAKYLNKEVAAVEALASQSELPAEICLEGEFIPASEAALAADETAKTAQATRVSKYIDAHRDSVKNAAAKKPTRVDKYLSQSDS